MTMLVSSSEPNHNAQQRAYFEGALKPTMVPADTVYLQRHVESLIRFGNMSRSERILEVGCGMGRYTLLLAKRGLQVEGLDLSSVLLERLRAYGTGIYDGPLYAADIADPPPELAGRFDVVVALFALHHMRDLAMVFDAMFRVVKPGGRVVFLEPNPYNPLFYIQIFATPGMSWQGDRGILMMRRRVILGGLQQAGFVEPKMERFGFLPPFAVNHPAGRRAEALLERVPFWRALLPFQLFQAQRPQYPC
jgi:SAM-dependent methyltransferase